MRKLTGHLRWEPDVKKPAGAVGVPAPFFAGGGESVPIINIRKEYQNGKRA
jgi:hypothetical protein